MVHIRPSHSDIYKVTHILWLFLKYHITWCCDRLPHAKVHLLQSHLLADNRRGRLATFKPFQTWDSLKIRPMVQKKVDHTL